MPFLQPYHQDQQETTRIPTLLTDRRSPPKELHRDLQAERRSRDGSMGGMVSMVAWGGKLLNEGCQFLQGTGTVTGKILVFTVYQTVSNQIHFHTQALGNHILFNVIADHETRRSFPSKQLQYLTIVTEIWFSMVKIFIGGYQRELRGFKISPTNSCLGPPCQGGKRGLVASTTVYPFSLTSCTMALANGGEGEACRRKSSNSCS